MKMAKIRVCYEGKSEALEKTTSQAGKDIQPEHEEDAKTVQKGLFRG